MTLAPGTRLGPYEISAPLGAGGMGEVYRAHDSRLGRDVAVKVLPQHLSSNPEIRARFEREAKTISSLNHPNICTLFDVGREGETDYLVMELVEGETLAQRLEKGPLPTAEMLRVGAQVAGALDRAHRAGVVHRDLKPGNIMLTKSGAKLMDFGLARASMSGGPVSGSGATMGALTQTPTVVSPLTTEGMLVGTFQYMSPEQLEGKEADTRSDLWALGCVLYEMATGARAFAGDSQASLIAAIMTGEPRSMTELQPITPPTLERIVTRCLQKKPDDRFQSAHDLAFALESLVPSSSGAAPAPGVSAPARPSSRRFAIAIGVVALAIVMAGLVIARMNAGRSDDGPTFTLKTFGHQAIFQARFAPDGQTIVVSAAKQGNTPELFVIRPGSPEPLALGIPGLHLLAISSKGELAVLAGARYLGHHRLFQGTLARMPIEGGAPRPMLDDVREADWSPDASGLAIIRERDGKDRIEYPIGKVLFETAGYVSDLRFSPKGDRIAFMEHPTRYDDRGTVDVVDLSGKAKVLTPIFSGEEGVAWTPGGRNVMFSGAISSGSACVMSVDLDGRRRVVFGGPGDMLVLDAGPEGRCLISREETPLGLSVRAPGTAAERDLAWLDVGMANALSADGRTLLFTDQSESAGNTYNACVRGTDGSAIVRLGEGTGGDISRDGSVVLAIVHSAQPRLMLYPTGVGEAARLDHSQLSVISTARFTSDAKHALVSGAEAGKAPRCYLLDVPGGALRPVTPAGTQAGIIAPDGHSIVARSSNAWVLYDVKGGAGRPLPGLSQDDIVIRWSTDSRSVLAYRASQVPLRVDQIDIATGKRAMYAEISPVDRAGLVSFLSIALADDPGVYAYGYQRYVSRLYLAEGMR